jgi:hypothetical protein
VAVCFDEFGHLLLHRDRSQKAVTFWQTPIGPIASVGDALSVVTGLTNRGFHCLPKRVEWFPEYQTTVNRRKGIVVRQHQFLLARVQLRLQEVHYPAVETGREYGYFRLSQLPLAGCHPDTRRQLKFLLYHLERGISFASVLPPSPERISSG